MGPQVSVIILNYNGKRFIDDCLSSVLDQDYKDYEVLFVDNGSSDGSVEYVKSKFPSARIVENRKNYGYAKGNNMGFEKARGKYIAILNPDVMVPRNWLKELVACLEKNNADIAQSKALLFDRRDKIDGDGGVINFLGFAWGGNHLRDDEKSECVEIPFAIGTSFMVRRSVVERIGFFDEDMFMYHEDVDFSWRARMMGMSIISAPKSIVYHKYSFSRNRTKNYYVERNRIIFLLKNLESGTLLRIFPCFVAMETGMIIYSIIDGWFTDKIRGYFYIINNLGNIMRNRRELQKSRIVNDRALEKYFTARIELEEIKNPILCKIINPLLDAYWRFVKG